MLHLLFAYPKSHKGSESIDFPTSAWYVLRFNAFLFMIFPFFFSGSYECKLCLTLHNNEGSYLAHTQGKKHQSNLARRAAKDAKDTPLQVLSNFCSLTTCWSVMKFNWLVCVLIIYSPLQRNQESNLRNSWKLADLVIALRNNETRKAINKVYYSKLTTQVNFVPTLALKSCRMDNVEI